MSIEALMKVAPPPKAPTDAYPGPWQATERAMGLALPPDYKDFIRVYGSGRFLDFFGYNNPFSKNPNLNLYQHAWLYDWYEKKGREDFPDDDEEPYEFWPTPGGLIIMGGSDHGDDLFWLPEGPPEAWKVVVWNRRNAPPQVFDCDMTTFTAGVVSGEILPDEFPKDLLPCDFVFVPDLPPEGATEAP